LVVGNKIEKIAVDIPAPKNATVIEAKGRTLIPGLIDNHVHLFMGPIRKVKCWKTPRILRDFTRGLRKNRSRC
jgi:imidazolonepropionase-like amidohydrolase